MGTISATVARAAVKRSAALSGDVAAALVGLADASVIFGTGVALFALYVGWQVDLAGSYAAVSAVYAGLCVLFFYLSGLYSLEAIARPGERLARIIAITGGTFLAILAFLFALKISDHFSRVWAFAWVAGSTLTLIGARAVISQYLVRRARSGALSCNIAIVGGGEPGQKLLEHFSGLDDPWNRVVGVFDDRLNRTEAEISGFPLLGNVDTLAAFVRDNRIDEIVVSLPWSAETRILGILDELRLLPVHVSLGPDLAGLHYLSAGYRRIAGVPVLGALRKPIDGWRAILKKTEDCVLGGLLFALASPVMLLTAIAIKLDSPGPVLFRQPRFGFNNKLIDVFKFRTMRADQSDVAGETLTQKNDARITRVGAFLRKTSIDELPQFINVLKGEMSIVGPRPHAVRAKAGDRLYQDVVAEYAARHKVKPGITGWAQVNGWRGETTRDHQILRRVDHDIFYIENWSLALDLKIILKTAWTVLRGDKAY